jgi:hypothetical protein
LSCSIAPRASASVRCNPSPVGTTCSSTWPIIVRRSASTRFTPRKASPSFGSLASTRTAAAADCTSSMAGWSLSASIFVRVVAMSAFISVEMPA